MFNFILAIILLFIVALNTGTPTNKNYISETTGGFPISETNIQSGDKILKVNMDLDYKPYEITKIVEKFDDYTLLVNKYNLMLIIIYLIILIFLFIFCY